MDGLPRTLGIGELLILLDFPDIRMRATASTTEANSAAAQ
jgi:hypothetical protein